MTRSGIALAAALLLGCGADAAPAPPIPLDPIIPEAARAHCDDQHVAMGPACVAVFDECRDDEVPNLGKGCQTIGPVCGPSFSAAASGCSPIFPPGDCGDSELGVPGRVACEAIGSCVGALDGDWHVDAAFGGASDGSVTRPFRTIAEAIAVADDDQTVAIAEGRYSEDLVVAKRVRLAGRCAAKVEIHGAATALTATSGATFEGLTVTSDGRGIVVDGAAVRLRSVVVRDTGDAGISALPLSGVDLHRVSVRRARSAGILGNGATITGDQVMVLDVDGAAGRGEGISISGDGLTAQSELAYVSVGRTKGAGIRVSGLRLKLGEAIVRDIDGIGVGTPPALPGVQSTFDLRRLTVERTTGDGIFVEGGAVSLLNGTIRDVGGRGLTVQKPAEGAGLSSAVASSLIDGALERGLSFSDVDARVAGTIVRGTRGAGAGLYAKHGRVTIESVAIRDSASAGIAAENAQIDGFGARIERSIGVGIDASSSDLGLAAAIVRHTLPLEGRRGIGILVSSDGDVAKRFTLKDALVADSAAAGIAAFGVDAAISGTRVRDTAIGVGVYVGPRPGSLARARLVVDGLSVERSQVAGLFAAADTVSLDGVLARFTAADASGRFGDGIAIASDTDGASGGPIPSLTDLTNLVAVANARAGLAMFGVSARLVNGWFLCNGFDVDLEERAGGASPPVPSSLDDRGPYTCGCVGSQTRCVAQSVGLSPPTGPSL